MAETGDLSMDSGQTVLEISSDEEGDSGVLDVDSIDWISEFIDVNLQGNDGLDEVVIVGVKSGPQKENLGAAKPSKSSLASKLNSGVDDDDDDDDEDECKILDGDPDGEKAVANDSEGGNDDLLIVGEKGQIACRDYPHSRHQCAKYPFKATLYNKHCNLCHCYVCDIPAPCVYWISEGSNTGHCHATDKEEIWRFKRKCLKEGVGVQKLPYPAFSTTSVRLSSVLPQTSPASRSFQIRSCLRVNRGAPGISSRVHSPRQLDSAYRANPLPLCPSPSRLPQTMTRRLPIPQRGRIVTGALRSNRLSPDLRFKRMGLSTAAAAASHVNQTGYESFDNNQPTVLKDDMNDKKWHDLLSLLDLDIDTLQNCPQQSNNSFTDLQTLACSSQPQAYKQCLSQSNLDATGYLVENSSVPMIGTDSNSFQCTYGWADAVSQATSMNAPPAPSLSNAHTSTGLASGSPSPQNTVVNSETVSWTYSLTSQSSSVISATDPVTPEMGYVSPCPLYDEYDNLWSG